MFAQLGKDWPYFTGGMIMLFVAVLSIIVFISARAEKPSE
jgi:hypothetical protein